MNNYFFLVFLPKYIVFSRRISFTRNGCSVKNGHQTIVEISLLRSTTEEHEKHA
jgi:hypothetical protein